MNHYDVIIIGAGASGISCARNLILNGKNVMLLEARNRIGGGDVYMIYKQKQWEIYI